jgi:hypothetical protein
MRDRENFIGTPCKAPVGLRDRTGSVPLQFTRAGAVRAVSAYAPYRDSILDGSTA